MTAQPDRPDGDGLLPAPGTILQIRGAAPGQGWGMNVIEVRESTGGVGWRWRSITAIENQWLIDALNAKVAPPTRDGAEGAVSRDAVVLLEYAVECLQETMTGKTSKIQAAISNINLAKNALRDVAPPKPAPDAMREAMIAECVRYARRLIDQEGHTAEWHASAKGLPEAIAALSSAPVPPADGTQSKATHCSADYGDHRCCYPHCLCPRSPSLAVAAEPVAWMCRSKGENQSWNEWLPISNEEKNKEPDDFYVYEYRPLYASPPVRGDREEAAKEIIELAISDGEWLGRHDSLEPSEVIRIRGLAVKVRTESILSLPVPPGTGERGADADLCAGGVKVGWDKCSKCGATSDDECKAPKSTTKTCLDDIGLKITNELYKAVSGHTGDACLLAMIGSWGDTLDDPDILAGVQRYNEMGECFIPEASSRQASHSSSEKE